MVTLDCPNHHEAVWTTASAECSPDGCKPLLVRLPNVSVTGSGSNGRRMMRATSRAPGGVIFSAYADESE